MAAGAGTSSYQERTELAPTPDPTARKAALSYPAPGATWYDSETAGVLTMTQVGIMSVNEAREYLGHDLVWVGRGPSEGSLHG